MVLAGLATAAITTSGLPASAGAAPSSGLDIVQLGELPGGTGSRAAAVNDRGVIVGSSKTADGHDHAVRWDPDGRITDLGLLPGGGHSRATEINNNGDIVGAGDAAGENERAVRWAPDGTVTALDRVPGEHNSGANGINDDGYVVGSASVGHLMSLAVVWEPGGTAAPIGPASLQSTSAAAINNHAVVAGSTLESSRFNMFWAVTWTLGDARGVVLPHLPGARVRDTALSVNDNGLVVGRADSYLGSSPYYPDHAVVWSPGADVPTDLGTLPGGGDYSVANDVNDEGVIVGTAATNTTNGRQAVLWEREENGWRIVPLPQLPGGTWSEATAINDDGDVVGIAGNAQGQWVAVRWER